MNKPLRNHVTDLRGASRIAIDAIAGVTGLVEALHTSIARTPTQLGGPIVGAAVNGITAAVYRSVRGVARAIGGGIDFALDNLTPALGRLESSPAREAVLAALNGVLGDYLAETANPLAIRMQLRRAGKPLEPTRPALAAAIAAPTSKLLVLVHGLCMNDLGWDRAGHEHGSALARDLAYTPVYLHYNTGLHISTNGHALAHLLETLVDAWPVPLTEVSILAHSMGGLVARSALHYAGAADLAWPAKLRTLVFLGTPHHGAPLERGGHWLELLLEKTPYTAPFTRLGKVRSAGITDLRHGCVLDEDWQGRDRYAKRADPRRPLPLPDHIQCYAIAATLGPPGSVPDDASIGAGLVGDGLVTVASALGRHRDPRFTLAFPASHQWVAYGCNHLGLLSSAEVCAQVRDWLADSVAHSVAN